MSDENLLSCETNISGLILTGVSPARLGYYFAGVWPLKTPLDISVSTAFLSRNIAHQSLVAYRTTSELVI